MRSSAYASCDLHFHLGYSDGWGQALAPLYTPKTPIPKALYKTWSLFLIINPQWVVAESNDKVKKLYDQCQALGRAIGIGSRRGMVLVGRYLRRFVLLQSGRCHQQRRFLPKTKPRAQRRTVHSGDNRGIPAPA